MPDLMSIPQVVTYVGSNATLATAITACDTATNAGIASLKQNSLTPGQNAISSFTIGCLVINQNSQTAFGFTVARTVSYATYVAQS